MGLEQSRANPTFCLLQNNDGFALPVFYVDDMGLFANTHIVVKRIIQTSRRILEFES